MMMSEAERQYYLGRAGIHLWYARAPLPGAAPSPEFQFPVADSDDAPEPESDLTVTRSSMPPMPRTGSGGAGKDRLAGIQALMATPEPEPDKTAEPAVTGTVEPPAADMDEPSPEQILPAPDASIDLDPKARIEARLGFWVSEHLVLVSSVSEDASERLQDTLAENILASLGESGVKESHHIRWPVFGNPRVPGNSDDDFRHILRSVSKEFGSRKLLLLGVLKGDVPSGRSEWLASTLGAPAVDFPRSLAELAAVPTYKRELWQQLKFAFGV
ncbi:2-isopropylmalate synthase [Marinobacter orientalis]|uniref:2-isopropylmalate synthase n=1 Tax=Marinobacter orientalis TaxID=1928859 RepID=A0A7Y0WSP0_9GAMM|nr:2-isopropylmalate synthase [Marinobacter orientalis]NMT63986.1 2-isopropylmalate synthase [Marinobacter orientalis]TGX49224.1 2-isopropylmalate synthase [Marinobacter orientalis]